MPCAGCFEKQIEIDKLKQEIEHLKGKLNYQKEKEKEGYFGSSTPSSKKPFKKNANNENPEKNGGGKKGHKGHGRKSADETQEDVIIDYLEYGDKCPCCGEELIDKGHVNRTTIESRPVKAEKILNKCDKKYCPKCKKTFVAKPKVLSRGLYGNQLVANACVMHYFHGIPMGRIEEVFGGNISSGGLFDVFHRLAEIFEKAIDPLIIDYRNSLVRHADETGWKTDGQSGYSWIFCTKFITIFRFRGTRAASVAHEVFGSVELTGFLVVDRYGGYNRILCKIQYCYAHLLRTVEDLGKQFIDNNEVQNFVSSLASLLSEAMYLHSKNISDKEYYEKANEIKNAIINVNNLKAENFGIQNVQEIFKKNVNRLYHWADNRNVPADNNRAEREFRLTVIARKISFGSQSKDGAKTREILMTILHTSSKRLKGQTLEDWFKFALDKIVLNPKIDPYSLLPTVTV